VPPRALPPPRSTPWRGPLALALTQTLALACAPAVVVDAPATTSGAGGAATSIYVGRGGSGGAPLDAGAGDAATCGPTHDGVTLRLTTFDGNVYACAPGDAGAGEDVVVLGAIAEIADDHLVVDGCAPGQACPPLRSRLDFAAPGLSPRAPLGAFVELRVHVDPSPCRARAIVQAIPEWAGAPSPAGPGERLVLAAAEGTRDALLDAPFTARRTVDTCGDATPASRAIAFAWPGLAALTVPMGVTTPWPLGGSGRTVDARVLRAFRDEGDVAYWLAEE
jgi:hypothetical protein